MFSWNCAQYSKIVAQSRENKDKAFNQTLKQRFRCLRFVAVKKKTETIKRPSLTLWKSLKLQLVKFFFLPFNFGREKNFPLYFQLRWFTFQTFLERESERERERKLTRWNCWTIGERGRREKREWKEWKTKETKLKDSEVERKKWTPKENKDR